MSEQSILIIDDNVNLALGFAQLLGHAGYTVHTAHTAADGFRLALVHRPTAIVLDYQMPMVNGAGFLYRLRDLPDYRHTPVMIVTGTTLSDQQQAEFADLRAVVRFKPIQPTDLLTDTARLMGSAAQPVG